MSKSRLMSCAMLLLGLVAVCMPLISWILSAFGYEVRSLLDDEGWRWIFSHATDTLFSHWVIVVVLAACSVGALEKCGLTAPWTQIRKKPFFASLAFVATVIYFLLFAALHPHSPLLSITGRLIPSPFMRGLPTVCCLSVVFASLIYGLLARRLRNAADICVCLTHGMSRYAPFIFSSMLVSYVVHCINYMLS